LQDDKNANEPSAGPTFSLRQGIWVSAPANATGAILVVITTDKDVAIDKIFRSLFKLPYLRTLYRIAPGKCKWIHPSDANKSRDFEASSAIVTAATSDSNERPMRKLILIKHSKPAVDEAVPSHEWRLSDEGRDRCGPLIERLRPHEPSIVITSNEPKAIESGEIVAAALKKPLEQAEGLHEHDRSNVPMMASRDFISTMALFFKDRRRLVVGKETAEQAAQRFAQAIERVIESHPDGNLAVVTHATVLALFASAHGAGDTFQLWRRLGLPSLVVFSLPDLSLLEVLERCN
jgi:broad specificity phosphatase PhoE